MNIRRTFFAALAVLLGAACTASSTVSSPVATDAGEDGSDDVGDGADASFDGTFECALKGGECFVIGQGFPGCHIMLPPSAVERPWSCGSGEICCGPLMPGEDASTAWPN